jgi:uncharacterized protein YjiS (DUF1127 family)
MIAHPASPTRLDALLRLGYACHRMLRNRRVLRELDDAQLADCGLSREDVAAAIDWRFWRRSDAWLVAGRAPATPRAPGRVAARATLASDAAT